MADASRPTTIPPLRWVRARPPAREALRATTGSPARRRGVGRVPGCMAARWRVTGGARALVACCSAGARRLVLPASIRPPDPRPSARHRVRAGCRRDLSLRRLAAGSLRWSVCFGSPRRRRTEFTPPTSLPGDRASRRRARPAPRHRCCAPRGQPRYQALHPSATATAARAFPRLAELARGWLPPLPDPGAVAAATLRATGPTRGSPTPAPGRPRCLHAGPSDALLADGTLRRWDARWWGPRGARIDSAALWPARVGEPDRGDDASGDDVAAPVGGERWSCTHPSPPARAGVSPCARGQPLGLRRRSRPSGRRRRCRLVHLASGGPFCSRSTTSRMQRPRALRAWSRVRLDPCVRGVALM